MAENMMVGSHKHSTKEWDEGYDRTFGKDVIKTEEQSKEMTEIDQSENVWGGGDVYFLLGGVDE